MVPIYEMHDNMVITGIAHKYQWRLHSQYTNISILAIINIGSTYTHIAAAVFPTGDDVPPYRPIKVKMLMTNCTISNINEIYLRTANFPMLSIREIICIFLLFPTDAPP